MKKEIKGLKGGKGIKEKQKKSFKPFVPFLPFVSLRTCHHQLHNREDKECNRKPDRQLEDHFLGTTALHIHRSASAECGRETRDPMLHEDARNQEQGNSDLEGNEEGGHGTSV